MNVMQFNGGQLNNQLAVEDSTIMQNSLDPIELNDLEIKGITRDFAEQLNLDLVSINTIVKSVGKDEPEVLALLPELDVEKDQQPEVIGDHQQSMLAYFLERATTLVETAVGFQRQPQLLEIPSDLIQEQQKAMPIKPTQELPVFAKTLLETDVKPASIQEQNRVVAMTVALMEKAKPTEGHANIHVTPSETLTTSDNTMNWSPIKLKGNQNEMAQQLHTVLRERIQIQADSRIQQATIRLDPPSLGKIEISVHLDAGKLNIQINSNQGDVHRALQQISNDLRQQLTEQNFVQVNVQVSAQHSQQGNGQQQHQQQEEKIISAQEITSHAATAERDDSILTTV